MMNDTETKQDFTAAGPVSRRGFLRLTAGAGAGLFVVWSQVACSSTAAPSSAPSATVPASASAKPSISAAPSVSASAPASVSAAPSASAAASAGTGPKKVQVLEFTTLPPAPPVAGAWSYPKDKPNAVDSYLQIGQDGTVTLMTGKVEFGQGIQTGFAQLVAEELDVALDKIKVIMGQTDSTPFDIGTFGSLSTRGTGPTVRAAAADAAQLDPRPGFHQVGSACRAAQHQGGQRVRYGRSLKDGDLRFPGSRAEVW